MLSGSLQAEPVWTNGAPTPTCRGYVVGTEADFVRLNKSVEKTDFAQGEPLKNAVERSSSSLGNNVGSEPNFISSTATVKKKVARCKKQKSKRFDDRGNPITGVGPDGSTYDSPLSSQEFAASSISVGKQASMKRPSVQSAVTTPRMSMRTAIMAAGVRPDTPIFTDRRASTKRGSVANANAGSLFPKSPRGPPPLQEEDDEDDLPEEPAAEAARPVVSEVGPMLHLRRPKLPMLRGASGESFSDSRDADVGELSAGTLHEFALNRQSTFTGEESTNSKFHRSDAQSLAHIRSCYFNLPAEDEDNICPKQSTLSRGSLFSCPDTMPKGGDSFVTVLHAQLDEAQRILGESHERAVQMVASAVETLLSTGGSEGSLRQQIGYLKAELEAARNQNNKSCSGACHGQHARPSVDRRSGVRGFNAAASGVEHRRRPSKEIVIPEATNCDSPRKSVTKRRPVCNDADQYKLLDMWLDDGEPMSPGMRRLNGMQSVASMASLRSYEGGSMEDTETMMPAMTWAQSVFPRFGLSWIEYAWSLCYIRPSSTRNSCWKMLQIIMATYDMIALPLTVFFYTRGHFVATMTWLTRLFWLIDIPVNCCTGYIDDTGASVKSPSDIWRRYRRRRFFFDLSLVVLDWMEVIVPAVKENSAARSVLRLCLLLRLLRIARVYGVVKVFTERLRSEWQAILIDIALHLILIFFLAHLIACMWYGLGDIGMGNGSWVESYQADIPRTLSMTYLYFTCLHWSLSQLTGGMDELRPQNTEERAFAIVIFLLCFVVAAFFVSSITSSLTQLHMLASGKAREISTLRWYLQENGIPTTLCARILRNAHRALEIQRNNTSEDSVELLRLVSEPLRIQLHYEQFLPYIQKHPFFNRYSRECKHAMSKVCHHAISFEFVSVGDIIFDAGELPQDAGFYIVCKGKLMYSPVLGDKAVLTAGHWCGEGTLWMRWVHVGTLQALDETKLCVMNARAFQNIVGKYNHRGYDPRQYAAAWIAGAKEQQGGFTDLSMGFEDIAAVSDTMHEMGMTRTSATGDEEKGSKELRGNSPRPLTSRRMSLGSSGSRESKVSRISFRKPFR